MSLHYQASKLKEDQILTSIIPTACPQAHRNFGHVSTSMLSIVHVVSSSAFRNSDQIVSPTRIAMRSLEILLDLHQLLSNNPFPKRSLHD